MVVLLIICCLLIGFIVGYEIQEDKIIRCYEAIIECQEAGIL